MKTIVLILLLLPVVAFGQGYFDGYTEGYGAGGASAPPDTFTWVWVNSFDTGVENDTHESSFVPAFASIDSFIQDTDGTRFLYGAPYSTTPTVLNYQNNIIKQALSSREDNYPEAATYQPFFYWSLEDIPASAEIISAKLSYRINIGLTSFTDAHQYVAVIDTSSTNFASYSAGDIRTSPDNYHYREPAWDYADAGATTAWSFDLDTFLSFDYGWTKMGYLSVVIPPATVSTSNWYEEDLTSLVRKYHADGLSEKLIWFFGDGAAAQSFRGGIGPNATNAATTQPVLVVEWTTGDLEKGIDFAVFSDNHSNHYAIQLMGAAIDGAGFDPSFLVHNGDMNYLSNTASIDTTIAIQDTLAANWKEIPIALVGGNHEASGDTPLLETVPAANKRFFQEVLTLGGRVTKLGARDNFEMRYRNFSYDIGGVHFVQMDFENNVSGIDSTTTQDIKWLESDLASSAEDIKIVFFHRPFLLNDDVDPPYSSPGGAQDPSPNWAALKSTLENGGVDAVFSGHTHLPWHESTGGIDYFNTPSTGNFVSEADQGFMTVSVSSSGVGTVKLYRGKNADHEYVLTQTFSF